MPRISALWRANVIAFISSFCVMVIELIAARILAPHIGVSLYTWTSIIGVILAGIALGNYLGGKVADRYPSPLVLAAIFLVGGLATIAILPAVKVVASATWFSNLPVMLSFTLKTSLIFFLPAIILSLVSPLVIKLTLADLGLEQAGGVVGTIYACSTAGAILGTFMTGFFFILWFGTSLIVWLVAAVLLVMGVITWFVWRVPGRWRLSLRNFIIWIAIIEVLLTAVFLFRFRESWQEKYTKESNYFTIQVLDATGNVKVLILDHLVHSYVVPDNPMALEYDYAPVFADIVSYVSNVIWEKPPSRVLHLGGGGYAFPRYLEAVYPASVNEVVEIDPAVTEVAYEELGLPRNTSIKTYNEDARYFLIQRKIGDKYDIVVGDVFNDRSTPYHLTTLEFDRLVKANMTEDGIYLVNIVDDYKNGRYMPSFIHTLKQAFRNVYLLNTGEEWGELELATFIVVATDRTIDLADYQKFATRDGKRNISGYPHDEAKLEAYLAQREPILLTDEHVPTDILVAQLIR